MDAVRHVGDWRVKQAVAKVCLTRALSAVSMPLTGQSDEQR